jgi:apolipoprotein N-acyltransferase
VPYLKRSRKGESSMTTKSRSIFLSAFGLGLLYSLSLPVAFGKIEVPIIPFSAPLSVGLLLFLLRPLSIRRSLQVTMAFLFGIGLLGLYWIPYTIKEFGGLSWAPSILIAIPFFFICYPYFYLFIAFLRFAKKREHKTTQALTFATLATLAEWLPMTLFPAPIGAHALIFSPHLSPGAYFGVSGYSFFFFFLAYTLQDFLKTKTVEKLSLAFLLSFPLITLLFPLNLPLSEHSLKVRMVQSNIGHAMKLDAEIGFREAREFIKKIYYNLSTDQISEEDEKKPDLIVWPETAFPELIDQESPLPDGIVAILNQEIPLLFGGYAPEVDPVTKREKGEHNSLFLLQKGKESIDRQFYHKMKLLPFGETLPFGPLNSIIYPLLPEVSQFGQGLEQNALKLHLPNIKDTILITPLICYEVLFPHFFYTFLNQYRFQSRLIVNVTNDSWYGPTNEPYQHLWLSRWRAIEAQAPMIRSTNTGITTVIDPLGQVHNSRLNYDEQGNLDIDIPLYLGHSPKKFFQLFGPFGIFIFALPFFLLSFFFSRKKACTKKIV